LRRRRRRRRRRRALTPRGPPQKKHQPNRKNNRDKYENEDLIKHALPTDVWVHADGFSSPHGYIRVPFDPEVAAAAAAAAHKGAGTRKQAQPFIPPMPRIPQEVLDDCCQLVKEGSIKGCKESSLPMIYMPAANLKKTSDMETGAVGHWRDDCVLKCVVEKRDPAALKRLEKTKKEVYPDLAAERAAYDLSARGEKQAAERRRRDEDKAEREEKRRLDDLRSYKSLMGGGAMAEGATTNAEMREKYATAEDYEDDFM
jgi:hypothetical protein